MKKLFVVCLLLLFWGNSLFAASIYGKKGKGPLKITTHIANDLEYYFSGGKRGKYKAKQERAWKPFFIVISVDGTESSKFVMPDSYSGSFAPGNYVGQALQECKKLSGKECFVFADKYKIIWDNGSDKKKRSLKRKDIMAGKTLQILQELGFYDGGITQTKKIEKKKIEKKKETKKNYTVIVKNKKDKLAFTKRVKPSKEDAIAEALKGCRVYFESQGKEMQDACYIDSINGKKYTTTEKTSQTGNSNDIVQQMKDLKELYDSGVLTKEEFEKAKKKLLN